MELNFFARIRLAICDFRLYPYIVQKEKLIHAILYFLGFILLISAVLATGVSVKLLNWLNDFMLVYDSQVEEFTIENGKLNLENQMNFEFDDVQVYGNDSLTVDDIEANINKINNNQNLMFIAVRDGIGFGNKEHGIIALRFDQHFSTNKQDIYEMLKYSITSPVFRISLAVAILCGVYFAYLALKFIHVLFVAVALLFLGLVFRTQYKFLDYLKVAFYIMTLPVIIEAIALLVIGRINGYANFTYFALMYLYMYYAIRALKLDNIIMATQQKILGMKFTNGLEEDINAEKQKEEEKKKTDESKEVNGDNNKDSKKDENVEKQNDDNKDK